ncbi:inversin-like isoform X2 [Oscarella lobularis]
MNNASIPCSLCARSPKPILEAATHGHTPCIVACLRQRGGLFDANTRDDFGATALHLASRRGHLDVLRYLVEYGEAGVEPVRARNGASPAHDAAATGNLACLRYLVAHTACSAHDRDNNSATPIHWATQMGHLDVVRWLVDEADARLDAKTKSGVTPIHFAAAKNQLAVLEYLVDMTSYSDQFVNATASNGATPTYFAAQEGHLPCVRYLVGKCKADANLRANDGMTCLHAASQEGHLDCVRWLITSGGCRVKARAGDGATATHYAASQGHLHVLQWLIESAGSTGVERDNYGGTPAHDAAEQGQLRVLQYLHDHDVSLLLVDKDDNSPIDLARNNDHADCVAFLEEAMRVQREREAEMATFRPKELRRRGSSRASSIKVEEWVEETKAAASQQSPVEPILVNPEAKRQWEEMQKLIEEEQKRSRKLGSVKDQRWAESEQLRIADAARERRRRQDLEASLRTARLEVERIAQRQHYESEPSVREVDDGYRRDEEKRRRYRLLREQEERAIKQRRLEEERARQKALEEKKRKDEEERQRILKERQEFWLVEMQKRSEEERKATEERKDVERRRQEEKERKRKEEEEARERKKRDEERRKKEEENRKRLRKEEEQRRKRLRKEEKEKEKARERALKEREKLMKKLEKKKKERGELLDVSAAQTPQERRARLSSNAADEAHPPLPGIVIKRAKEFERKHADAVKSGSSFSLFRRSRKPTKTKPAIEGRSSRVPVAPPLESTSSETSLLSKGQLSRQGLSASSTPSSKGNSRRSSVTDTGLSSTPPPSKSTTKSTTSAKSSLSRALQAAKDTKSAAPAAPATTKSSLDAEEMRQTTSPAAMMAALERALAASPKPTAAAQNENDVDLPENESSGGGADLMHELAQSKRHFDDEDENSGDEMVEAAMVTIKTATSPDTNEAPSFPAAHASSSIPVAPPPEPQSGQQIIVGGQEVNVKRSSLDPIAEDDEPEQ